MEPQTYFGYIETIRDDSSKVEREKCRLDEEILSLTRRIRAQVTEENAPSLIWMLALREIRQVSDSVQHLSEHRVTDFAGQARFLRGVAASTAFTEFHLGSDPDIEKLLTCCDQLWVLIGHREMINNLGIADEDAFRKSHAAAVMSLLSAFQLEIKYAEQAEHRLISLFSPFSKEVVEPQIGLTVGEIAEGIRTIRRLVFKRLQDGQDLMEPALGEWEKYKNLYDSGASGESLDAFLGSGKDKPWIGHNFHKGQEAVIAVLVIRPSDVSCLSHEKAQQLLDAFSFIPGEVNQQFETPFDTDTVRSRPFARLADHSYLLVDLYYSAFSPTYRLIECFGDDKLKQQLCRHRDVLLEEEAATLLETVVQPQSKLTNYFAPIGPQAELFERDLLLVRDRIALVCESKAKPLRDIGDHRGNVRKIESDVKNAIQYGYNQACSVINFLKRTDGEIVFYNSDAVSRNEIATFAPGEITEAFPIVITDSYYGLISTDLLPWLKVDPIIGFPWVVDRDTLESIFSVLYSLRVLY
jgi:hypothetical protein